MMKNHTTEGIAFVAKGFFQEMPLIPPSQWSAFKAHCDILEESLHQGINMKYGFGEKDFMAQGFQKYSCDDNITLYDKVYLEYVTKNKQDGITSVIPEFGLP